MTHEDHVTRTAFLSYLGVLITIFLTVNVAVISLTFSRISDVEIRTNSRIEKIEQKADETNRILTDIRLSLSVLETRLGISKEEKERIKAIIQ